MRREIDAPAQEWLSTDAAAKWLMDQFPISARLFEELLESGWIPGVRRLRNTVAIPWKGLVVALYRLELGDLPPEAGANDGASERIRAQTGGKAAHSRKSGGIGAQSSAPPSADEGDG